MKKSDILGFLTPKKIILSAIKDKLEGTGIVKMVLVFNLKTDRYNIMLSQIDNKSMKLDIEQDEINMIKRLFISKVHRQYLKYSNKEIDDIIIEVNLQTDEFNIFVQDEYKRVEKFDY